MLEASRCPVCGENYAPPTQFCLNDGARLEVVQTLIGRVLHDRYRIESFIGEGGMGTVYRATHIELEDKFAIKVLNPDLVNNENAIRRFRQEARAARVIKHPNAVGVTDFGVTADNLVYLVMEFVEGRPLRELIRADTIEYHRAVKLLGQMCDAIEAAHQNKIIHRDLKPENVMVQGEEGRELVKVLDFGIAKLLEENPAHPQQGRLTKAGTIIGTPQYMAPEQCQNKELGPAADIYSLGIIGYEMLSGTPPFTGRGPTDFFIKHLHHKPAPLQDVAPQVPDVIAHEIMQALEKNPAARQPSAAELARRLRSAVRRADGQLSGGHLQTTLFEDEPLEERLEPDSQFAHGADKAVSFTKPESHQTEVIARGRPTSEPRQVSPVTPPEKAPQKARVPMTVGAMALVLLSIAGYLIITKLIPNRQGREPGITTPSPESIDLVLIPGGKFVMGRNDGDADERPEHEVEVRDFYLDKYEVTNQQYKKCVDAKKCRAPGNWKNNTYSAGEELLPVTYVTWTDAVAYARFVGKRLPTEEEWEYAARGGSKGNAYPWGNEWIPNSANIGNIVPKPLRIGSFERDQVFGVYDLAGNVSEWVQDDYLIYVQGQPFPKCPGCKVYRGGNFVDVVEDGRASKRWAVYLNVPKEYADVVFPRVGFRCARDAK